MKKKILILFLFLPTISISQNLSNLKQRTLIVSDTIFLDSATVIPNTIRIFSNNDLISDSLWQYNSQKSKLILQKLKDSIITVEYRIIEYDFNRKRNFYDSLKIIQKNTDNNNLKYQNEIDLFSDKELNTHGSITRGFNIGNNQDPVLNSKMNLQIAGKLNDNLNVEAIISDESIPIQPDGNTAQIQDFNKIFLKVFSNNFNIVAGDIDVEQKDVFLKYQKQFKGIEYNLFNVTNKDSSVAGDVSFGIAVSKGKYQRQKIIPIEGNQGPYKLSGQNNETFILVLSASEQVYVDGKLLVRGETNDYVINYNSAEITFSPKIPINKNNRIIVEFEYSERNYSRFITFSNNNFKVGKSDFYFDLYSEKDAKNQPIDIELTDTMKQILFDAGDDFNSAILPTYSSVNYDIDKVLYKRIDTLIEGVIFSIFSYVNEYYSDVYSVSFSYLGPNLGDYIIAAENTNGRVYKWVAPSNGIKQGDYSPTKIIISPKKHSVFEIGGNVFVNSGTKFNFSTALSDSDLNLFSDKDDNDNIGEALNFSFEKLINNKTIDSSLLSLNVEYSFSSKNFSAVEQFKTQEFDRDWNIDTLLFSDEHMLDFGIVRKKQKSVFDLNMSSLFYPGKYLGFKPSLQGNRVGEKLYFKYDVSYLFSKLTNSLKSDFLRTNIYINYKVKNFILGGIYDSEINSWKRENQTAFLNESYRYYSVGAYVQNEDSLKHILKFEYKKRWDYLPKNGEIKMSDYSDDFSIVFVRKRNNFYSDYLINYRILNVLDTTISNQLSANNLNARTTLNFSFLKKSIKENFYLGLSSGLEPKMQYVYIQVEPSRGSYTWNDYNNDEIKQIDEFEIAQFSDQANFVRIPLQTQNFLKVYTKKISNTLNFNPGKFFETGTKAGYFFSKINNLFTISVDYKGADFNLLEYKMNSASKYNFTIYNFLNINPLSGVFINYLLQKNSSKILMVNGNDFFNQKSNKFSVKYKYNSSWLISSNFEFFDKASNSDYSVYRNYNFRGNKTTLKFIFFQNIMDLSFNYTYTDNRNIQGNERLFSNTFGVDFNSSFQKKYYLSAEINLIENNFHGTTTSSVSYLMLDGLKPGINSTWQFSIKRNLNKVIQVSLIYSGRYSPGIKAIHNGSINIVAFL